MTNGNGHEEEGQDKKEDRVKHCPFLNDWCIKERCALYSELRRQVGGFQQNFGACGFSAVVLILSEINQKTGIAPPQPIKLPGGLFRG